MSTTNGTRLLVGIVLMLGLSQWGCEPAVRDLVCAGYDTDQPFASSLPSEMGENAFLLEKLAPFLEARCYEQFDWQKDKLARRWTSHGWIRIHYSPEAVTWGGPPNDRQGEIPDGTTIVKAQYGAEDDQDVAWWTVMVKDRAISYDGWYWAFFTNIKKLSVVLAVPDLEKKLSGLEDLQTLQPLSIGGNPVCLNCHASAVSESTFFDYANITGDAPQPATDVPPPDQQNPDLPVGPHLATVLLNFIEEKAVGLPASDPGFLTAFGIETPVDPAVVKRLPGEGLDYVTSGPDGPTQYLTANACAVGCHEVNRNTKELHPANSSTDRGPAPYMLHLVADDEPGYNLSPYGQAHASVMGRSGRDPVFLAQLESEGVLHANKKAEIENLCFRCHGAMGQRQLEIDSGGTELFALDMLYAMGDDPHATYGALARDGVSCTICHHIEIDENRPFEETFTGNFDVGPANVIYGPYTDNVRPKPMQNALGLTPQASPRLADGQLAIKSSKICGSCHTVYLDVLDDEGNVLKKNFEQTTYLEWLNSDYQNEAAPISADAKTCQGCHMKQTLDDPAHAGPAIDLSFKIANIQDDTFKTVFPMAYQLPDADLTLEQRSPYAQHTLLGINLFTMEMYNQFTQSTYLPANEILGLRGYDMQTMGTPEGGHLGTPDAIPSGEFAARQGLAQARNETAEVTVSSAIVGGSDLEAQIHVTNLVGHHFPSGVGFRRAFLEVTVLDASENVLWISGATDPYGIILGADGQPLPSEFFEEVDGQQAYQPHYEVITSQDQVQIYEELVTSPPPASKFTTSFLSLYEHVKDNRLQPRGWRIGGPYGDITQPRGAATGDCNYVTDTRCGTYGQGSSGSDAITYRIPLADLADQPVTVRATLYYQSIPPYYLAQRFSILDTCTERNPTAPWSDGCFPETVRLLYMTSALDVDTEIAGEKPLQGWRLAVAGDRSVIGGP